MKLYCDTGNLADFEREDVDGWTTNPSLCRAAGVTDYADFAYHAALSSCGRPVSLEVTATDRDEIVRQAHLLSAYGSHVYVKVPACDAAGHPRYALIRHLVREGIRVNVTAVLALPQVEALVDVLRIETPAIVSIFCGRIADTGRDPGPIVFRAAELFKKQPKTRVLWASAREVYNIAQAERAFANAITMSPALLDKWKAMKGRGLRSLARDTVAQFESDSREAGFTL